MLEIFHCHSNVIKVAKEKEEDIIISWNALEKIYATRKLSLMGPNILTGISNINKSLTINTICFYVIVTGKFLTLKCQFNNPILVCVILLAQWSKIMERVNKFSIVIRQLGILCQRIVTNMIFHVTKLIRS